MPEKTTLDTIVEQVQAAAAQGTPLVIRGGGSKAFLGRDCAGEILDVSGLRGIVQYEPTELVITAWAGTPLAEIEAALAERGQMLGFEPPHFGTTATLGGTIACGLSGPARPFRGAARDFVLGVKLVNGRGEALGFGGEVMKNVAGYDLSRLMCGAHGTLGVLLEISLKVLPLPAEQRFLALECNADEALARMAEWQRLPLPLSGLCHDGERLRMRLSGAAQAVAAAQHRIGGEPDDKGVRFWARLREQQSGFFTTGDEALWRVSVPPTSPRLALSGKQLIDWGGALRWLRTDAPAATLFQAARAAGGHATAVRGVADARFQPLPPALLALHRRLKQAFDPHGILNRGRLYPDL